MGKKKKSKKANPSDAGDGKSQIGVTKSANGNSQINVNKTANGKSQISVTKPANRKSKISITKPANGKSQISGVTKPANGKSKISITKPANGKSQISVNKPEVEVVKFQNPRKRKQSTEFRGDDASAPATKKEKPTQKVSQHEQGACMNLKDASFDVFKFGITGLDTKSKRESEMALAIRLGAKPPKNECKNYKLLQREKKEKKLQDAALKNEFTSRNERVVVNQLSLNSNKSKKKKRDVFHAQLGTYKDGVQVLRKSDIQTMKRMH